MGGTRVNKSSQVKTKTHWGGPGPRGGSGGSGGSEGQTHLARVSHRTGTRRPYPLWRSERGRSFGQRSTRRREDGRARASSRRRTSERSSGFAAQPKGDWKRRVCGTIRSV